MIRTIFYEPVNREKFRQNIKIRWSKYSTETASFNAEDSMAQRINRELIYHILDATIFVRLPSQPIMVGITANVTRLNNNQIEQAKSLLEEITRIKLIEVK
ncbi:MAG: hypothetical protein AABX07_00230 [Nanoarchaeota archaeon]